MFVWHREIDRLDLPAGEIFQLQRSLNRIQVALSGFPSQEAEAYLVLFAAGAGVRAAVALHLQTSGRLAIYLNEPGPLPPPRATRLLDEGIAFAESMGFMLGDLDFPLLSDSEKAALWDGLPVKIGLPAGKGAAAPPGAAAAPERTVAPPPPAKEEAARKAAPPREKPAPADARKEPAPTHPRTEEAVAAHPVAPPQDPVAEVPLPRTLRARKRAPTAEEMAAKRLKLREALGKVLASL